MGKKIALALIAVLAGFAGFIATRPSNFRVERSIVLAAPADIPFGLIRDFHQWTRWSPWEHLDPAMKKTFEGPEVGVGAVYAWEGNDKVGKGRMTLTGEKPDEQVEIKLEFLSPWEATNQTRFVLAADGQGTRVTWSMEGAQNFMAKAFSVFMNMDSLVGADFEKGLAELKAAGEAEAKKRTAEAEARKAAGSAAPEEGRAP